MLSKISCYLKDPPLAIWIFGPSGKGKTRFVKDFVTRQGWSVYRNKSYEKWWDSYAQEDVVIFEEFRGLYPLTYFLELLDRPTFHVSRRNRKPIPFVSPIVFSEMPPDFYFQNEFYQGSNIHQLFRRLYCFEILSYEPTDEIENPYTHQFEFDGKLTSWKEILSHEIFSGSFWFLIVLLFFTVHTF